MTDSSGLAQALVDAQTAMPAVKKDGKNPHFDSTFVTLDELIAVTRPVLNQHGLAIRQLPITNDAGMPILRTTIVHGASGEELTADTPLFLPRNDMQAFGAAVTYARRYAWAAMLGIASEEDDDGNSATPTDAAPSQPKAKMITDAQKKKLGAVVNQLDRDAAPIPPECAEAETWVEVLRLRLEQDYGVVTRTALTSSQASRLIDWFESMAIPF
jgi:hypothetical protein